MIAFTAGAGTSLDGSLYCVRDEYSFRFEVGSPDDLAQRVVSDVTSLAIGTLQVEVAVSTGRALFVWGLHPHTRWESGSASPERLREGSVHAASTEPLVRAVTQVMAEVGEWKTVYDEASGWLRVAPTADVDDEQILIATGTALGLRGTCLNAIWLNPVLES